MPIALVPLGEQLCRYLERQWQKPVQFVAIQQIPGGASRETYRVVLRVDSDERTVILRRDPKTSLIDTERAHEYRTYQAVWRSGFPVPEPLFLEEDGAWLERPFSVMAEVPGCSSRVADLAGDEHTELRAALGRQKWSLLGRLSAMDPAELGVTGFMSVPVHPALHELDYWADVIEADALHPQPVAAAAIRWLRAHLPPPSERLALVHGDYRSGNFLFAPDASIRAVLDWEMAHIGDPLEDLAWSLDPLWPWPERHLAGGLLPRHDAVAIWEAASGMKLDREVFRWWQVFASVKALAIWISSTEDFANGEAKEPILAVAGWVMTDRQNRILVDRLHPERPARYAEALL